MYRAVIPFLVATQALAETPPISCGGAAPSWALEIDAPGAVFSAPDMAQISYEIALTTPAEGQDWPRALTLISARDTAIAIIGERACGIATAGPHNTHSIELLTQRGSTALMFTGCCRPRE